MSQPRQPYGDWIKTHVFSATDLENYRLCPYRFYASAYLKLRPEDPFEVELKPAEIGAVTHHVLEKLLQARPTSGLAHRLLDEELAKARENRPHLSQPLLALQKSRMARMLDGFVEDLEREKAEDAAWKPRFFEWEFGGADSPPLKLTDADGKPVSFRGRIDRIDVNESKKTFLVIDYKTGSTKITGNQIREGSALQLPLYLLAVKSLLLRDYDPAGAVYHHLSDLSKNNGLLHGDRMPAFLGVGPRSSSLVPAAKWDGLLENIEARIGETVAAIRNTREEDFVSKDEACEPFCPYQDICLLRSGCPR